MLLYSCTAVADFMLRALPRPAVASRGRRVRSVLLPLLALHGCGGMSAPRLVSRDLAGVAAFLNSDACRNVVVLSGAGVSCASGIPDFRSPGGMYKTLKPELITATPAQRAAMAREPMTVVSRDLFLENQFPYHEVRRPFILGTEAGEWKATLFHRFLEVLDAKGKLLRVFTQNIDGLDFQTGVDPARIVPCHGSIAQCACEICDAPLPFGEYCARVRSNIKDIYSVDPSAPKASSNLRCDACGKNGLKSKTVLFGGQLPSTFFDALQADLPRADLVLVAGTSLVVSPANAVAARAPPGAVRVVLNNERVGEDLGLRFDGGGREDVFLEGDCDGVVAALAEAADWLGELAPFADRLPGASRAALQSRL